MILPAPDEIRKMRGRDLLKLGAEWFEAEGASAVASIEAVEKAYGPAVVGDEMRLRASASFAFATLLDTVAAKAASPNPRREDGVFASLLVNVLRSGFLWKAPETTKNAA